MANKPTTGPPRPRPSSRPQPTNLPLHDDDVILSSKGVASAKSAHQGTVRDLAYRVFLPYCLRLNTGSIAEATRSALKMAETALEETSRYSRGE